MNTTKTLCIPFMFDVRGRPIAFRGTFPNLGTITMFLESSAAVQVSPAHILYDTIRVMGRIPPCPPELLDALARHLSEHYHAVLETRTSVLFETMDCSLRVHFDQVDAMCEAIVDLVHEEGAKITSSA